MWKEVLYPKPDGTFNCVLETTYKPLGYSCGPDLPLQDNKKCTRTDTYLAGKEKICINGATLVNEDACIIKNETAEKIERQYCEEHAFLRNNKCIVYEDINAFQSK